MNAVTLTWFKANDDYHDHFYFTSENKNVLIPFLDILNTNGDVWTEEGTHYPLIASKILRDHKYEFGFSRKDAAGKELHNQWLFRTFVDNQTNTPASSEDLKWLLESLANPAPAHLLVGHSNPYVKAFAEAIVDGKFKDIEFVVQEYTPGEIDKLVLE
jgi:hypothetical protein